MANKITKREKFIALRAEIENSGYSTDRISNGDFLEFIDHEIELLERKNSSDKKPTAQQMQNNFIKTAITETLEPNRLYTVTEIIKTVPECAELTNQRVSALLRQMILDGIVEKIEDKRKSYFKVVEG